MFGASADYWERLRSWAIPHIHDILSRYGYWAEAPATHEEYVTTVRHDPEAVEVLLDEWGFYRNPVAGLKTNEHGDEEVGSWRRVYDLSGTPDPTGSWQLHIRLFPGPTDDETDIYAHWERNWATHPIDHYNSVGLSYSRAFTRTMAVVMHSYERDEYYDRYAS